MSYFKENFVKAHSWLIMSYVSGSTDAKARLDEVIMELTPEKLVEA